MARYTINNIELPSSTGITGQVDDGKSEGLKGWATGCMEKWCIDNILSYISDAREVKKQTIMTLEYKELERMLKDARFNYKEVSKDAMSVGSQVHGLIEKHIKGKLGVGEFPSLLNSKDSSEVRLGFTAFLEWEKKNVVRYIESEQPVACFDVKCSDFFTSNDVAMPVYYGGTLDCIAELKDGIYCIDFKTAKAHRKTDALQVASYKFARENCPEEIVVKFNGDPPYEKTFKMKPIKIDGIMVLRLDKETGIPDPKNYTKVYDKMLNSFFHLLDFYYEYATRRLSNNPRVKKTTAVSK
jgi:hypothetical protein